jgi:hypothetical protein
MKALVNIHAPDNDAALLDALCLLCDCLEFGSESLFGAIQEQAGPKLIEVMTALGQKKQDYV